MMTSITGIIRPCVSFISVHVEPMAMNTEPYCRTAITS